MKSKIRIFLRLIILIIILANFALLNSCTSGGGDGSNSSFTPVKDTIHHSFQNDTQKYNYNIFIENSASMDGYVGSKDITFQQAVYGLITSVNLANLVDTPKLFFVNRSTYPAINNPITADLNEYANKLNIKQFQANRPPHVNTDIADIMSLIFENSKNDVNVIISDFIYSRGGGNPSIGKEAIQQNAIANIVKHFLDKKDYDIVFMQFFAQFKGIYYSENTPVNKPKIDCERPYYMMVIGPHNAIRQFLEKTDRLSKFKQNGYRQMCYFHKPDQINKKAKITLIDKIGNYEFENDVNNLTVNNAEKNEDDDNQKGFQFSIAVDYSNIIEEPNYFIQTLNYNKVNNYNLIVEQIKDTTNVSVKGFTHLLKLKTKDLINPTDNIQITLNKNLPNWVDTSSSDDDSNILSNQQENKTFGLKYIIEGINQAFAAKYNVPLFSVSVRVNKGTSGSTNGLLIFFVFIIFAGIIFIIIKKIKQA